MKNKNFIAVKTTKIYCLPTCPAREPLPQNVVHYKTAAQAERNGFRPCKRCFPDFPYGKWIDQGASVLLMPPQEFDFSQCLKFLTRSPLEPCHVVENNILYKLEKFEGKPVLLKIQCRDQNTICIDFLTPRPKKSIRAKVAKFSPEIMGTNWLHLQDGTGAAGTNDLTITSAATAKVGDTVLVKGVVTTNKDFGFGYKYDVIIEKADVTIE